MQTNQGSGNPVGRTITPGVESMSADWGAVVVTGAAAVTIATTAAADTFVGGPRGACWIMVVGALNLMQTAGGLGVHTVVIEASVDGGATWGAVSGGVYPGILLDSSATLATPGIMIPVFCRFFPIQGGPRINVRFRARASTSAGAGTAEASLQAIVM